MLARHALAALVLLLCVGAADVASARCRVRNTTRVSFTIESGNTSNQRVGANTTTSIDDGRIVARGDDGRTVGGSCEAGDEIEIREERGALVIVHR